MLSRRAKVEQVWRLHQRPTALLAAVGVAKVNMAGANPSTAAGLERLYKAHVQRYAHICAHHNIQFHPLAFDTLGRAHKSTMGHIADLFTYRDKRADSSCWPTRKILRILADSLQSSSSACVLRA